MPLGDYQNLHFKIVFFLAKVLFNATRICKKIIWIVNKAEYHSTSWMSPIIYSPDYSYWNSKAPEQF